MILSYHQLISNVVIISFNAIHMLFDYDQVIMPNYIRSPISTVQFTRLR